MESQSKPRAPRAAFRAEARSQPSTGQEPGCCLAPLGQGLFCLSLPSAKPGEGDWDDQELLQPGMQTALARANAVGAYPADVARQWGFFGLDEQCAKVWVSLLRGIKT